MTKGLKLFLAIVLIVAAGGALGLWQLMQRGFSSREQPNGVEAFVARHLRHFAVPRSARGAANPVPNTPEILAEGRAHFADHCATCHANDGSGQIEIGQNLYPKAPDMRRRGTQSLSDGELFYIIHNGVRFTGMPAWGDATPENDTDSWKLVRFIRHLPNITKEELEEMKQLNPISRSDLEEETKIEKFLEGEDVQSKPQGQHHSSKE